MRPKLTKETVNERIKDRGLELISDYIDTKTKSEFKCHHGHYWIGTSSNIMRGSGCPACADTSLTKEIINQRISHRGLIMIDDYVNYRTKSQFKCQCGHFWMATSSDIDGCGNGCPVCAIYGYNTSKPGTLYALDFVTFIKYGITNDLTRRLNEHKKNGKFTIVFTKLFENGISARNLENQIKQTLGVKFVTKEICPDGYTETLCPTKLKDLIEMINKR